MNNIDLDIRNVVTKYGLESFYLYYMIILLLINDISLYSIAMYD